MTNTSFEYLWINTKLASTTKPPSVHTPAVEASQPRNTSDHKLLLTSIVLLFLSI